MRKAIVLVFCSLLLPGCVSTMIAASTTSASNASKTTEKQVDPAQITQFQNGVSTVADVQAKLGEPQQSAQKPEGGTTLTYIYRNASSNSASYVPFVRWGAGEVAVKTTDVVFEFDSAGRMLGNSTKETNRTCRFGKCPETPK